MRVEVRVVVKVKAVGLGNVYETVMKRPRTRANETEDGMHTFLNEFGSD